MADDGIGARIKQARLEMAARRRREVTQVELGRELGVTGVTVGRWEAGGAEPSLALITRLAEILGVSASWLAFGLGGAAPNDEEAAARHAQLPPPMVGHPGVPSPRPVAGARRRRANGGA